MNFDSSIIHHSRGVGYLVSLNHEKYKGQSETLIVIDESTSHAYEVKSKLQGYIAIEDKFKSKSNLVSINTPIKLNLEEGSSIVTSPIDSQQLKDLYNIENMDDLARLTTDVRSKYDGDYADVAVKVATIIFSDTDSEGALHNSGVTMTSGDIAKWALVSVINDVYEVCPEVVSDIHTPFVCMLYSGFLVMDSDQKIIKYLPYSTSEEVDLLALLNKETIDVILGDYSHQATSDKDLVDLAIRVSLNVFENADKLDNQYETDLINYKDYQLIRDFLRLHSKTLAKIDIGGFEKFLRSLKLKESLEFNSPEILDTRGLLESNTSYSFVERLKVRAESDGTTITLKLKDSSPINESYNLMKSIYSSIVAN